MSKVDLSGRVALVTGGGAGIGRAISETLVACGASVVIADCGTSINGEGADPASIETLAGALGKAAAFTESIASPSAAESAVALAVKRFGGIDIVVNNAAILRDGFIFKSDPHDWEAVLRTNLSAAYFVARAATPVMRDQVKAERGGKPYAWGRIVNIVSTAGLYGNFGQSPYASAKAGLFGLTRVIAHDMARSGVTCNAVAPFAATRVTESIKPANPAQEAYKRGALTVPAADVAAFVAYLCSPKAQDITGQLFAVRGREIFLMSQPRPVARLVAERGQDLDAQVRQALAPQFVKLETDLEAFATDPIV
ncbi:MAG TPA: SDR family NAD(P)-dependent oxidoreductase [Candidatus Sulfotelmatobacter sp.]|nr:SDR family NAD(P)-dependent oxidoreductase [Candidatus Sulfotelmatobacter sp.]